MIHSIKCVNPFFEDVLAGKKTFEVRKNDRRYKVGDLLLLHEYNPEREIYMKRRCLVEVTYMIKGSSLYGIRIGYAILGIRNFEYDTNRLDIEEFNKINVSTQKDES